MTQIDQTRVIALNLAVTMVNASQLSASEVLNVAGEFTAFLTAPQTSETSDPEPTPETPRRGPGRPPKAKAAEAAPAAKPAPKPAAPEQSEEAIVQQAVETAAAQATTVDKAAVSKVVADLLAANKRNEAVNLLKQFGASSVSGIAEKDYAAFVEKAAAILDSGDLTA